MRCVIMRCVMNEVHCSVDLSALVSSCLFSSIGSSFYPLASFFSLTILSFGLHDICLWVKGPKGSMSCIGQRYFRMSVRPSIRTSVHPSVRMSLRTSVRPSACPSVRPYVCKSIRRKRQYLVEAQGSSEDLRKPLCLCLASLPPRACSLFFFSNFASLFSLTLYPIVIR